MRCPRCGTQLEIDEKICKVCGEKIDEELLKTLELIEEIDNEEINTWEADAEGSYTKKREIILNVVAIIITIALIGLIFVPLIASR